MDTAKYTSKLERIGIQIVRKAVYKADELQMLHAIYNIYLYYPIQPLPSTTISAVLCGLLTHVSVTSIFTDQPGL